MVVLIHIQLLSIMLISYNLYTLDLFLTASGVALELIFQAITLVLYCFFLAMCAGHVD